MQPEDNSKSKQQLYQRCVMLSDRKIEANHQNAQHSTGPSTPEGRAAVRLNGLKHGLCAETIRHQELELSRRLEDIQCDNDGRLAFIDWMDDGPKSLMANLHRYEIRLERSAKNARQELGRRPVALVSTAPVEPTKAQPKTPPSPKIISIETVERPPAPIISDPEPPPSVPPADDPAPPTDK